MEKFFQLFRETLLPLSMLILIGYFFIKTPTDLLTWNLVLFIVVGSLAILIYLFILNKFYDLNPYEDPSFGEWGSIWNARLPLLFPTLLPITLIIVITEFFLDEKYEVFDTKSSLLGIIIMWGIVLFVAVILIAGSFHISERIYKFMKKKYFNK